MSALNYTVKKMILYYYYSLPKYGEETFQEIKYRSEKEKCCRTKARSITTTFIDSAQDVFSEQFLIDISLQRNCDVVIGKRNDGTLLCNPSQDRKDLGSINSNDFGIESLQYKEVAW